MQNTIGIFLTNKLPAALLSPDICSVVCCQWPDWQLPDVAGLYVHVLSNSADNCSSQTCKVGLTVLFTIAEPA